MNEPSLISFENLNDVCVIQFVEKRLRDREKMKSMSREISPLTRQFRKIVVDFTGIDYISSVLLGRLMHLHRQVKAMDGDIRLSNLEPMMYEVLEQAKFTKRFRVFATVAEAVESYDT